MSLVDLERTLRAELGPALRARRPAAPADLGRRALTARAPASRAPALAALALVAAASLSLLWRGDPATTERPLPARSLALPGGGESGAVRRLRQRIRALRREARKLARDAAVLSRRAADLAEHADATDDAIDDTAAELRALRREETGAAALDRTVKSCGDDPLCPLPPGPTLVDPDPGPDFTVEPAPAPAPRPAAGLAPSDADVATRIAPVAARLRRCASQAGATGVVMLTLTIAPDGTVAHTRSSLVGGRAFTTCAGNVLHRVRFAAPGGEVEVAYPLTP